MDPFTHIVVNLGFSAILGSLRTISETTTNIHSIIRRFDAKTSNRQILQALLKSDIQATLEVIEELLCHIDASKIESRPLQLVIHHIQDIVQQIERELVVIHEKDTWNRQLWMFYYLRAYTFDTHISRIHTLKRILDRRIDMLMKVINISKEIQLNANIEHKPPDWTNDT